MKHQTGRSSSLTDASRLVRPATSGQPHPPPVPSDLGLVPLPLGEPIHEKKGIKDETIELVEQRGDFRLGCVRT